MASPSALKRRIRTNRGGITTLKRVKQESVASIVERDTELTIQNWLELVDQDAELTCIPLSHNKRTGHLPKLLRDIILRLRSDTGLASPISMAARDHGKVRRQQGYTASMLVDESRFLEVSIFGTLQRNSSSVDFDKLMPDVVTIADEVDSQLEQSILAYVDDQRRTTKPFHSRPNQGGPRLLPQMQFSAHRKTGPKGPCLK
jgi:hypothetical protein